jgi:hypothetical protein
MHINVSRGMLAVQNLHFRHKSLNTSRQQDRAESPVRRPEFRRMEKPAGPLRWAEADSIMLA